MEIRNIGIMAHIDAGKTTTTERIIYYTGKSHKIGDVDSGNTVTDWMTQEQDRGITISSAAITCYWREHQINIIDTPGHVDFTAEVERSLRVLDGGIVIFSAVDGIQAQTETVWKQASKYGIPRLAYINKMDRVGADFIKVVEDIKNKFGIVPIVLQMPIGSESTFKGVVDIIRNKELHFEFKDDKPIVIEEVVREDFVENVKIFRENLIDSLSNFSERITELFLENSVIDDSLIMEEIRRCTISGFIVPVLVGTSLKNIGIEPLIDAIVDYLPSPFEKNFSVYSLKTDRSISIDPKNEENLSALVFKVQYFSAIAAHLYFIRVYSGELNSSKRVVNVTKNKREKFTRIFRVFSNKNEQINAIKAGDIGAVIGLKYSVTGDTLVEEGNEIILEPLVFPEPVVLISVEPERSSDDARLKEVLEIIAKEDPTFNYKENKETGQLLVSGMGELHLEIIIIRIRDEFKLNIYTGKPQISYRESLSLEVNDVFKFVNIFSGKEVDLKIGMIVSPLVRGEGNKIEFECSVDSLFQAAILRGITSVFSTGIIGYPIIDTGVKITSLDFDKGKINESVIESVSGLAFNEFFKRANPIKLEPIMMLEIRTPIEYTGEVVSTLNFVGGIIHSISNFEDYEIIKAEAAFEKLFGYTSVLRSSTKGRGDFTMEFSYFKEKHE
ncbi:elongation factor G [Borrelia miyamotoi]|uniref:Elongation factor G n=1 Tax=Borrelia miyamotoi TaxID=47466 RepID=A0AAQ2WW11_9SPIR|nr:elongation factor G [Borrelia miyamotoi]AJA58976.1 elongation factor G [Borrelia miyamotoi]AOW96070.1 translation elongation factor G [Borrelia miyamotoi]QTL83774.1 elongation factor G [Borrelia miyamotoi]WAZ84921.1 elongation factor G [Borrelia miyamotoi]WAZ90704.1 elongation factor G [Borrelia miyamotoi]